MKKHYYKNEPQQNLIMGLVTSGMIACAGALLIILIEIIERETAMIHYSYELEDEYFMLPFVALGLVIFSILRNRLKRKLYNQVESALDD